MSTLENTAFWYYFADSAVFYISNIGISRTVTATPINLKKCNKIFQVRLNILPKLQLIFCFQQQKIQKTIHFWHFTGHNSWSKYDNQTNDPIFLIYSLSSISWSFSFSNFQTFKIHLSGVSPLHYVLVCKIHIYMLKITLSSLLTQIFYFYEQFASFWYITCFVPNLITILPQFHELLVLVIAWFRVELMINLTSGN